MSYTQRFTEVNYPLDQLPPEDFGPGTNNGAWVSLRDYHRAVALLHVGVITATGTVDFSLEQAQDAAGTGAKAITGKAITQLTQAGGDGDQIVAIELRTEELDVNGGFEYVRAVLVTGTAAALVSNILLGIVPRFPPVPVTNWSEVVD